MAHRNEKDRKVISKMGLPSLYRLRLTTMKI